MEYPKRKNNRLIDYDYSKSGAYFITICTKDKNSILSELEYQFRRDSPCGCPQLKLTQLGNICTDTICELEKKYSVRITNFIIMPNHVHLIVFIDCIERTGASPVPTISNIIGAYKSIVANKWLKVCKQNNMKMGNVWERSFYDHIIRDDEDYYIKARYIEENPIRWCEKHNLL